MNDRTMSASPFLHVVERVLDREIDSAGDDNAEADRERGLHVVHRRMELVVTPPLASVVVSLDGRMTIS
jgi:hypothetical protein